MLKWMFDDLQHLLISLARCLKYFHDVELLYPSQTFLIFNMFTCSSSIPWYLWPTQSWGLCLNMWTCWRSKTFQTHQMLLLLFFFNKDQFCILLMLKIIFSWSLAKKRVQANANCSAPNTVIGVQMKDIYHFYNFVKKASIWIFIYCRCKSGSQVG